MLLPFSVLDVHHEPHKLINGCTSISPERTQLIAFATDQVPALNCDSNLSWKPAGSGPGTSALWAFVQTRVDDQDVRCASNCPSASHWRVAIASLAPASCLCFSLEAAIEHFGEPWHMRTMSTCSTLHFFNIKMYNK